ncbi:hypothetical protein EBT31_09050, partial [bacterium]|nr:hypothetical protein [bacterium]
LTLLSTLASFLTGGLPKLLELFKDRGDKKHELEMMRISIERETQMAERGFVAQQRIEEIRADAAAAQAAASERLALYKHDTDIGKGASQWVIGLRASVRPVITYGMFFMLCFINGFGCWYAVQQGVPFNEALATLWDEETQALFASIIAFHFGTRSFGR